MNNNIDNQLLNGKGYIIVKVASGYGAIPIENASIIIRGIEDNNSFVFISIMSNDDGMSAKIELPTVNKIESQTPTNKTPYSLYSIEVIKEGFYPQFYQNVPIFDGITSLQSANLVPISDSNTDSYPKDEEYFNENSNGGLY